LIDSKRRIFSLLAKLASLINTKNYETCGAPKAWHDVPFSQVLLRYLLDKALLLWPCFCWRRQIWYKISYIGGCYYLYEIWFAYAWACLLYIFEEGV